MKLSKCGPLARSVICRFIALAGLFLFFSINLLSVELVSTGCGGSAAPLASISTVELSATVTSPSATTDLSALSLSKGKIKYQVEDAPVSGVTCHFSTLEGEDLGEAVSDANGGVSLAVPVEDLAGSEDVDSTTWSEPFVIHCDNGIELYSEIAYTEGETTTHDAGEADTDSTLATEQVYDALSDQVGFDVAPGDDVSAVKTAADFTCIYKSAHAMWGNSGLEGDGVADDLGLLGDAIDAYFAAGGAWTSLGYESIGDFYDAALDGTLDDGNAWNDILTTASTVDSSFDPAVYGEAYDDSFALYDAMHSFIFEDIGGGGAGTASVSGSSSALVKRQTADTLCASVKDGSLDPKAILAPMLAAEDLDQFNSTYGNDTGGTVFFGTLSDCLADGCGDFIAHPHTFTGFMAGFAGDYSSVWDSAGGAWADDQFVGGAFAMMSSCTGATAEQMATCGTAMQGTVYSGAGGWNSFYDSSTGAWDTAEFNYWGGYWVGQAVLGFDDKSADIGSVCGSAWGTYGDTFSGLDVGGELDACRAEETAAGTYEYWRCYDNAGYTADFNSYVGWNAGTTASGTAYTYCGDFICSTGEDAWCTMDCDADYISENPDYGKYCGDNICSTEIGETSLYCCMDCGACSESFCGDNICGADETAAETPSAGLTYCPYDCGMQCGWNGCQADKGETEVTCLLDCGSGGQNLCNYNHICESGGTNAETVATCWYDCGAYCGNSMCEAGETAANCSIDCAGGAYCGDMVCNGVETSVMCPVDCGGSYCGNSVCGADETAVNCPYDCH